MSRRVGFAVLLVGVLAVVLLVRPGQPDEPGTTTDAGEGATTAAPVPSEEAYCEAFRSMDAVYSEYLIAPDARGVELLEEHLTELLETGIPDSMGPTARGGHALHLIDAYSELGRQFDPASLPGTVDLREADASRSALTTWLGDYCPGW